MEKGLRLRMKYRKRKGIIRDEEGRLFAVFGVEVVDREGNVLSVIEDIFVDEREANSFIKNCNKYKLSEIHLFEVVEDYLATLE